MMKRFLHRIPVICGILFLLTAVIAVAGAWIRDSHRFDMGISFSAYVGLSRVTSVLYFITAMLMIGMLAVYILNMKIWLPKRIVYAAVLLCILGTAFFPYNFYSEHPTAFTIRLHNDFAIGLMLVTTVSFILSAVHPNGRKQRGISLLSIAYAAGFIALYFMGFMPLFRTFFIWENFFIVLLLVVFQSEQYGE